MDPETFYTVLAIGIGLGFWVGLTIGYIIWRKPWRYKKTELAYYHRENQTFHNGRCYKICGEEFIVLDN